MVVFIFVIAVVMARTTAEAGMLMTETTFRPIDLYRMFGNLHSLGAANLTALAFFDSLVLRDQRGLLLTGFLDSARVADGAGLNRRRVGWVIVGAVVCGLLVAVPLQLVLPYKLGALRMDAWMEHGSYVMSFDDYQQYFVPGSHAIRTPWQMPVFFLIGAAVTLFLSTMRSMFYWWPLHPLGYAIAGSWSTVEFWFPCLLAWIAKSLIMRYGGSKVYQKARPMMLGMIVGEFGMAVLSVAANILFHAEPPSFPWS